MEKKKSLLELYKFSKIYACDNNLNKKPLTDIIVNNISLCHPRSAKFSFLYDKEVYKYTSLNDHSYFAKQTNTKIKKPFNFPKFKIDIIWSNNDKNKTNNLLNIENIINKIYNFLIILKNGTINIIVQNPVKNNITQIERIIILAKNKNEKINNYKNDSYSLRYIILQKQFLESLNKISKS